MAWNSQQWTTVYRCHCRVIIVIPDFGGQVIEIILKGDFHNKYSRDLMPFVRFAMWDRPNCEPLKCTLNA